MGKFVNKIGSIKISYAELVSIKFKETRAPDLHIKHLTEDEFIQTLKTNVLKAFMFSALKSKRLFYAGIVPQTQQF